MASSSTAPQVQYDVFLSFRGKDVRDSFTSHLYAALRGKKIDTFIDDELVRGEQISPALLNAIERSEISVVIFSEGYASSRWCLKELKKILECRNNHDQVVMPVFYRVDPSDVRHQTGAFGNGFAELEERFKHKPEKLKKWRDVLKEAAGLSGFDSNVIRSESILIENIVEEVLKRLNDEPTLIENKNLFGMNSRIEKIESLLCKNHKIGIWGIGGLGKTTLARAVFEKILRYFQCSHFIPNIREESENNKRLTDLRQKLLSAILKDKDADLKSPFTRRRLRRAKVLIVFDDVTHLDQIKYLIGDFDNLNSESRIIITTRDKHVLVNCEIDYIYETKRLSNYASFRLFSRHAFGQNHLMLEDFMQLSREVLTYAKGVPLALESLGSYLFKRNKQDWKSAIKGFKESPYVDIQKVLKVSYNGLTDEEQKIFLDIAFFFKGYNRDLIEAILDACGFKTRIGISVLIEKTLITESFNTIKMHDLYQRMGREIVRQESPDDPGKRSRLWHHEDISSLLLTTKNRGPTSIRGIHWNMSKVGGIYLKPKAFSNMPDLKFLQVWEDDDEVHGFESVEYDFGELRHFLWSGYSAKSLPPSFCPKSLVALEMPFSKLEQLPLGGQDLVNLKHINLGNSNNLLKIPDLSQTTNLESLKLDSCKSLNLKHCISFNSLLRGINWKFLQDLILSNSSIVKKVPFIPSSVKELSLDGTRIEELPSIKHPSRLRTLRLENCSRLESLPEDICQLESLEILLLSGCSKLDRLPDNLGDLRALRWVTADRIAIKEVPSSIACLSNLVTLDLSRNNFESLPTSIKDLSNLGDLYLDYCKRLQSLPTSIKDLSNLNNLGVSNCKRLQSLPELPHKLELLVADGCSSLEAISGLPNLCLSMRSDAEVFSFMNCLKLDFNALPAIADVLQRIEQNVDVWFQNEFKRERSRIPCHGLISYPGSEVPGWFNLQNIGSFIELPAGWLNDNLVGFALCVVISPSDDEESEPESEPDLAVKFRLYIDRILISGHHCRWGWSIIDELESDHVFLGYDYNIMKTDKLHTFNSNSEGFIQFYVGDDFDEEFIEYERVKKCGVRLLYTKDYLRTDADADERINNGKTITFPHPEIYRQMIECDVEEEEED